MTVVHLFDETRPVRLCARCDRPLTLAEASPYPFSQWDPVNRRFVDVLVHADRSVCRGTDD